MKMPRFYLNVPRVVIVRFIAKFVEINTIVNELRVVYVRLKWVSEFY